MSITVATSATSRCIRSHVEQATEVSCARSPTPKTLKMSSRSLFMPSTTFDIEPSLPRSALPEPHTETKVMMETANMLQQMLIVEKICNKPLARGLKWIPCRCTDISRKAIEKPHISAACVATAPKFSLKRLSSFSRSSIVRCLIELRNRSLSAASISTPRRRGACSESRCELAS